MYDTKEIMWSIAEQLDGKDGGQRSDLSLSLIFSLSLYIYIYIYMYIVVFIYMNLVTCEKQPNAA